MSTLGIESQVRLLQVAINAKYVVLVHTLLTGIQLNAKTVLKMLYAMVG